MVPIEQDRYGCTVAELYADRTYLNAAMVRGGMAWHYERYSDDCPSRSAIVAAPVAACSRGVGVFAGEHQPPWEWRSDKR
jgi:endonuclease YncB( thermonuclease family)